MRRVLVIDDDDQMRRMLRKMLERAGYSVMDAADGKIGIGLHRSNPADLIITDVFMPEKDGIETIMELHRDYPRLKIIAISGGDKRMDFSCLDMARHLGAMRVIPKPFGMENFLKVVRELLESE